MGRTNLMKCAALIFIILISNTVMAHGKMNTAKKINQHIVLNEKKGNINGTGLVEMKNKNFNKINVNYLTLGVRVKKNQNQAIWIKGVQVIVYNMLPLNA